MPASRGPHRLITAPHSAHPARLTEGLGRAYSLPKRCRGHPTRPAAWLIGSESQSALNMRTLHFYTDSCGSATSMSRCASSACCRQPPTCGAARPATPCTAGCNPIQEATTLFVRHVAVHAQREAHTRMWSEAAARLTDLQACNSLPPLCPPSASPLRHLCILAASSLHPLCLTSLLHRLRIPSAPPLLSSAPLTVGAAGASLELGQARAQQRRR